LSDTHWLDEVGDYSGTQRNKYVLESDGSAVINSSHITSQTVVTKKGTATATVSTGEIAIGSGWISEIVLSDGTVYFLEESSGTNFYDSSGAGNDATLTGTGTWSIKRDLTLINNANKYGYTLTGNVIIPVDLSNLALNAEGAALQFVGRVASDMKFIESNCIKLNGTDGGGTLSSPVAFTSEFYIEEYLKIDSITASNGHVYANSTGNGRIFYANERFGVDFNTGNTFYTEDIIEEGVLSLFRFWFYMDGGVVKLDVLKDGVLVSTTITSLTAIDITIDALGLKRGSGTGIGTFEGSRCGLNLNGLQFPISEGSGTTSYAFEDSAKIITWLGGATWSTQDSFHHNITQGFSVSGAVKLPYKISGTVAGVNILPYSEDLTQWIPFAGVVSSLITDVFGVENNAQVFAAAGSEVTIRDIITIPESNTFYSISFFAKSIAGSGVLIIHGGVKRGATYIDFSFLNTFNFATKEFGNVGTDLTPRYEEMNNGWFKIVIEDYNGTDDNGVGTSFQTGFKISDGDSFALFGYQLENTATITAYQKTTGTATAGTFLDAYSNAATNGHNQAETKLKQVTFREDFGASGLHFDQSDLASEVITYADIANTANVFVNQFPNVKINLETFSPVGIINQSNRQNNGLRRNKDTFFGNNK
jgi:hypothetical protein